jgi:hypothetical protein
MFLIVLFTLRASAIAMPPLGPSLFCSRLILEGVTQLGMIGMLYRRRNKKKRKGQYQVKGSSHDYGDGLVDLEHLSDRNAALGAEIIVPQTEIGGGNIYIIRNVVTAAVTQLRVTTFLIVLPPLISAFYITISAPRAAWRSLKHSRLTRHSRTSSKARLPILCFHDNAHICYRGLASFVTAAVTKRNWC